MKNKKRGRYRVLLMCKPCDKVYNGTSLMGYADAVRWHYNTLMQCKDVCKNKDCEELLIAEIQDMEKPPKEKKDD